MIFRLNQEPLFLLLWEFKMADFESSVKSLLEDIKYIQGCSEILIRDYPSRKHPEKRKLIKLINYHAKSASDNILFEKILK